jgi:[acyl-carrier-protein] S-malonyltransferase
MIRTDLAFVFPGQGSQSVGMLAALSQVHPEVRATFEEASTAISIDLWSLSQDGPETELNRTINTQPALLAAGVAVWRTWLAAGGARPAAMAGHSLGEYTALVCSGALSLADGIRLVRERGRLMQEAVAEGVGAMAAVLNADLSLLEEVCQAVSTSTEPVVPANLNAPGQIVLSGAAAALERALAMLAERGVKRAIRLPVSVPSHSPLMQPAAARLAEYLVNVSIVAPQIPVIHNADVSSHGDPDAIRAALALQLHAPVRWIETVQKLVAAGARNALECGPGKVLVGMGKRIAPELQMQAIADPVILSQALMETQA